MINKTSIVNRTGKVGTAVGSRQMRDFAEKMGGAFFLDFSCKKEAFVVV